MTDWRSVKNNNITSWGLKQSSRINAREFVILLMGVGAQNGFGGTKVLPETWLESCLTNQSFFLSKLRWPPKKKVFTHIKTVFLSSARKILLGKLVQMTYNCPKFWRNIAQKIWNRPKFWRKIAQNIWNCPKFCPKVGYLTTTGGPVPPCPPTSYAYDFAYHS